MGGCWRRRCAEGFRFGGAGLELGLGVGRGCSGFRVRDGFGVGVGVEFEVGFEVGFEVESGVGLGDCCS